MSGIGEANNFSNFLDVSSLPFLAAPRFKTKNASLLLPSAINHLGDSGTKRQGIIRDNTERDKTICNIFHS